MNLDTSIPLRDVGSGKVAENLGNMLAQIKNNRMQSAYNESPNEEAAIQQIKKIDLDAGIKLQEAKQREMAFKENHRAKLLENKVNEMDHIAGILEGMDMNNPGPDLQQEWNMASQTARVYGIDMPPQVNAIWRKQFIDMTKGMSGKLKEIKAGQEESMTVETERLKNEFLVTPTFKTIIDMAGTNKITLDEAVNRISKFGKGSKGAQLALTAAIQESYPNWNPAQAKLDTKMITPSGTSGFGMLQNKLIYGVEGSALFKKNANGDFEINKMNYPEIAMTIAKIVSPSGVVSDDVRKELQQKSLKNDWAGILAYLGFPVKNATPQGIARQYAETIDRLMASTTEQIKNFKGVLPVNVQKIHYTPLVGKKQQEKLSPQDQEAIDWAKKNPNDPRAKEILKLHGM